VVKARTLNGEPNLLFLRNSLTGTIEVRRRVGVGIELNEALHAN
jgi:2,3,4,5-tetrahydropyridine-2-carboxylate N-succinyltransferase